MICAKPLKKTKITHRKEKWKKIYELKQNQTLTTEMWKRQFLNRFRFHRFTT